MKFSDPLFILYTPGTTGKPKGTFQTHGGFSIFCAHQSSYLIDLKSTDTILWYADIGWITGHTWIVNGSPIIDQLLSFLKTLGLSIYGLLGKASG